MVCATEEQQQAGAYSVVDTIAITLFRVDCFSQKVLNLFRNKTKL